MSTPTKGEVITTKNVENKSTTGTPPAETPSVTEKHLDSKIVEKVADKQHAVKSDAKVEDKPAELENVLKSGDKKVEKNVVTDKLESETESVVTTNKKIAEKSPEPKPQSNNTVEVADPNVEGEIYTVEALLKSRVRKSKGTEYKEYLVKWKGYTSKYNTWVSSDGRLLNLKSSFV